MPQSFKNPVLPIINTDLKVNRILKELDTEVSNNNNDDVSNVQSTLWTIKRLSYRWNQANVAAHFVPHIILLVSVQDKYTSGTPLKMGHSLHKSKSYSVPAGILQNLPFKINARNSWLTNGHRKQPVRYTYRYQTLSMYAAFNIK